MYNYISHTIMKELMQVTGVPVLHTRIIYVRKCAIRQWYETQRNKMEWFAQINFKHRFHSRRVLVPYKQKLYLHWQLIVP